ncbi:hypothetical protein MMAD_18260 [Mycolicibacterium madagascariense]|uniref:Activator of Hsp90 ATPase homologue 1/2-like C-terminal domain-containing protein n=1 Tax=Mycolicibacterium madagascariense TaxID=212765 RepID=A0A7I7XEI5_9MYCO|nr:SRPBCC domain-containing protein [Mycolicibacterium madagascariense]MCV7015238.1 SRPBCC domain-containing protein [Mycolicibacterium madagascariense]BBZ27531.1 hypothetical protein MMAD_18260 [Mycolicibacterium madagascariense]
MSTISHAIRIRAPRDEVFEAIATTKGLQGWYAPRVTGELAVHEEIVAEAADGEVFRWKLLSQNPGTSAEWECVSGPGSSAGTRVMHRLSETDDGRTAVEVDHDGWSEEDDAIPTCNTLWGILIGRLRDYVESGSATHALG